MKTSVGIIVMLFLVWASCSNQKNTTVSVQSPSKNIEIQLLLEADGTANYSVNYKDKSVIEQSALGFDFENQSSLKNGLKIIGSTSKTINENWEMPWGEQRMVANHYNELIVNLEETAAPNRQFNLYFRAYDDGVGFRYELLKQEGVDSIFITNENTEFNLSGDHKTWWIPADWDSYEHLYRTTKVSEINALKGVDTTIAQSSVRENAMHTPVTMKAENGLHISIHEANLTDYASMTLKVDNEKLTFRSSLVGSDNFEHKVQRALPFKTPWRTIQIGEKATDLLASNLIINLNEPNKIGDVSWVTPMKYVGIWWEMHINKSSWDLASGKHGATTENTKRYIDFAAKNGFKGVLVEGWNTGWEYWTDPLKKEHVFDFVTPYPDYDLVALAAYGKEKGVQIIMHNETSASVANYEKHLDSAFALMKNLGIHSVKTGYVGNIIPKGEHHHGQWMVNHYRKVLEIGAKNQVAINAHEPIKDTGIRRTYPNAIAREGLRGQEFNAWSGDGGNPPEHLPIVVFTRMLSGPIDFTPGVFDIALPTKENNQINTTLAQQLALYVVIYSPIQMACDLPENYEGQPAFQFIKDVGVDWEKSKFINGEIGDFVTIAREEKSTGNWFVGGITDENPREITIDFSFLDKNATYEVTIYKDGEKAHFKDNPTAIAIEKITITKDSKQTFKLAAGGGFAISLLKK
jgi:hypothetical protein